MKGRERVCACVCVCVCACGGVCETERKREEEGEGDVEAEKCDYAWVHSKRHRQTVTKTGIECTCGGYMCVFLQYGPQLFQCG